MNLGRLPDNDGHVDYASSAGLLQLVNHPADIWYIGVYNPSQALGAFTLVSRPATAAALTFDGGSTAQAGHLPGVWRWFRVDVPAGPVGWDLWLRDVTAGNPRLVVRRNFLPDHLATQGWPGNSTWPTPAHMYCWPSGASWYPDSDLTQRPQDPGAVNVQARRMTCGMGRPLEPGSYYIGVYNQASNGQAAAYTLASRGIGSGLAIPVTAVGFTGGSSTIANLAARDLAVFKVTVPAATPLWSLCLLPSAGEMMMALLKDTAPSGGGIGSNDPWQSFQPGSSPGCLVQKPGSEFLSLFPPDLAAVVPAGDYYIAVVSEGVSPANSFTAGSGGASGVLQSAGAALTDLGAVVAGSPVSRLVSLSGGQTQCFTVNVAAGTAALEIRLDNRTGYPVAAVCPGAVAPCADPAMSYIYYGYRGGKTSGTKAGSTVITFANPPAGLFTLTVRAGDDGNSPPSYPAAAATLVVTALPPTPVDFDGGTATVSGQQKDTWHFFRVVVPAGPLGWDLWLKNVTAGDPRMVVMRDSLPDQLLTHGWPVNSNWPTPANLNQWPSGAAWCPATDLTQRSQDPGGNDVRFRRLTCGMGHPLEPGTYFIGVFNQSSNGTAAAYTLASRGIGNGLAIPVSTIGFTGGSAALTNIGARDLAVFKVTVPAATALWSLRLLPSAGEMMMTVLKDAVPSSGAYWYNDPWNSHSPGLRIQKDGAEYLSLFAPEPDPALAAGDYYIAVASEGVSPPDSITAGTGNASGVLQSVGAALTDIGTATVGSPIRQAVSLAGGETNCFVVNVPAGTAALEVRLDDRTGNPQLSARAGSMAPTAVPASGGDDYGYHGGYATGTRTDPAILTFANPPAGPFVLTIRAGADGWPVAFPAATANLVVSALPPTPVDFDGGSATVAGQRSNTWRYFRVVVPDGPIGWDLRLRDVTGGMPQMAVCRDLLPGGIWTGNSNYGDPWSPAHQSSWPSGWQWADRTDLTNRAGDPGPVDSTFRHLTCGMGHPLEPGTYFVGVLNQSASETASYAIESRGIGDGLAISVSEIAFAGGSAAITDLAARDLAVFKVTVPAGADHWSLALTPSAGEMMMAVLKGAAPTSDGDWCPHPWQADSPCFRVQKTGAEFLSLFACEPDLALPEGDYYVAVVSEGDAPPDWNTAGDGTAAGTLTSIGRPRADLGTVVTGSPVSQAVALAGGETQVFTVNVPAGTVTMQVRLDDRTGNPQVSACAGGMAPCADATSGGGDYGYDGGYWTGTQGGPAILTFDNPPEGSFTITVRARTDDTQPGWSYPDATATLVVEAIQTAALNFGSYANAYGGSNQDSRELPDGARFLYQVEVPASVDGLPVLGWKVTTAVTQGAVSLKFFSDPLTRAPDYETTAATAMVMPPFLTPGMTWYMEVTATGLTDYTVTSEPVLPQTLDFGSYLDGGGGGNRDQREITDGEKHIYQIDVPETAGDQPVLGWKITTTLAQGAVNLTFFTDPVEQIPLWYADGGTAVVLPPVLTPGMTWYCEVTGSGLTDYTLISEPLLAQALNFGSYANGGGGSNQDQQQITDGDKRLYQIDVPATVDGQPVLGWKVDATLRQGDVSLCFFTDPVGRYPYCLTTSDTAVIVPPFLTPGTWYCEVTGIGITDYTLTSEPVTLRRSAWSLPPAGQLSTTPGLVGSTTCGDTGIDSAGNPLPDDQGTDLGQDDWHFYAVTVPLGNRGVLRTVLEALNGNPDLFLRRAAIPTTTHSMIPPALPGPVCDYASTGGTTQYGNWVPLSARWETELAAGTWYLGVTASGGSNCRYRLKISIGDIQTLPLNGGSFASQALIAGDWRYYAVRIPAAAPNNWLVGFSTQQGNIEVHWRNTLPPGDCSGNPACPGDTLRDACDDALNQGPYPAGGWTSPGTYAIATPPLRPDSTVYLGVKADSDAVFSISSATSGGTLPVADALDPYCGRFAGLVPTGDGLVFRIVVPADATHLKFLGTQAGDIEFRLEQGTWPTPDGACHWTSNFGATEVLCNLPLNPGSWPWQANRTYYLRLVNHGAAAEPVTLKLVSTTALTEDENNDGLYDAWEQLHFGDYWSSTDPDDDPDGDGLSNLMEAVLGNDPNVADQGATVVGEASGNPPVMAITFTLADPVPATATIRVEGSDDLSEGSWETIASRVSNGPWSGSADVQQSTPANGKVTVTVRDTAHAGTSARFLRLRVDP